MPVVPLTDRVPDDELVRQIAAGDSPAFAELFRRRHSVVFRFALHMTGSASTADDVVQDVFLIVMRDAAGYQSDRAAVAAWLCGIARNCVRQRMDRDRRLTSLDLTGGREPASTDGGATDALAGLLRSERIETLRRAVQTLPLPYRETLVLCDLQELSYEDASQALACPVGTVRSRLHRARAMLAAKLTASQASHASLPASDGSTAPEAIAETDQRRDARQASRAEPGAKGCYA